MRGVAEPDRRQAFTGIKNLAAQEIAPEGEVLQHAERGLDRVAMTEIVRLFRQGQFGVAASEFRANAKLERERENSADKVAEAAIRRTSLVRMLAVEAVGPWSFSVAGKL